MLNNYIRRILLKAKISLILIVLEAKRLGDRYKKIV
jgi:hypothetical protein